MRVMVNLFLLLFCLIFSLSVRALPSQRDYPHWNFKDPVVYQKLVKIDNFINANKNKGYVAVFDWDGTLYSEQIPLKDSHPVSRWPGDGIWRMWASKHLHDPLYPHMFPMFRTAGKNNGQAIEIRERDDYFEGRTPIHVAGYNLFTQLAVFEAGMTPQEFDHDISGYLQDYPVKDYVFYPMLDLMQHLVDSGFDVWITTGGNPYFVAVVLKNIEKNLNYTSKQKYRFNLTSVPYHPASSHIIGNMARLLRNGRFSMVYDSRFEHNPMHHFYIVDGKGKYIGIKYYIEQLTKKPAVFYAGNSGGDYWGIKYIIQKKQLETLGVAVNPYGTLTELIKQYPSKIIVLQEQSKIQ